MTPDKHSAPKVLGAIAIGVAVGVVTHSWGWGIGSFAMAMFLVVWVADWIFGNRPSGESVAGEELDGLLDKLEAIGRTKAGLPMSERSWCNSLGLHVQLKEAAGITRLEAGDIRHARLDAWRDPSRSGLLWSIRKLERGDWERLVNPTLDIAVFLDSRRSPGGLSDRDRDSLRDAVALFDETGELDLPW